VIGVGLISGEEPLQALALVTPGEAYKGPRYEAVRIPGNATSDGRMPSTRVSLLNTGAYAQEATIELLDQRTGAVV